MTWFARLIALVATLLAAPVMAQGQYVVVEEWVEITPVSGASRFVSPQQERVEREAIGAYGPFRVLNDGVAVLVDITDSRSPAQFSAMLRAFPDIAVIEFVEAPGTHDDLANLRLGRMIRERGIDTRVDTGGSVRSGAVELFIAGATRTIAADAEFAVHGWLDYHGFGAEDYPASAPEHRRYLDYYAEMGMDRSQAAAFYAMTNSVPFEEALWLTGGEMGEWLEHETVTQPRLAYLDLSLVLP